MKCPRGCGELAAEQQQGITVDRCAGCQGTWLDLGEGEVLTRPGAPIPDAVRAEVAMLDARGPASDDSALLTCPRCEKTMGRETFSQSGVVLDRCGCGVWLDRGELEKIRVHRERALNDLRRQRGDEDFPPELYEQAFARFYFDLGTPPS